APRYRICTLVLQEDGRASWRTGAMVQATTRPVQRGAKAGKTRPSRSSPRGAARPARRRGIDWPTPSPERGSRRPHRILVGTASWSDPGFIEEWYPKKLPARGRLAWYAEHFDLVEVNSSFYAVPSPEAVQRWVEQTPAHF